MSPSLGGASPISHPRGPPQGPKAARNMKKITKFSSAVFFGGKEGKNFLKTIRNQVFLIFPTLSPPWGIDSAINHPRVACANISKLIPHPGHGDILRAWVYYEAKRSLNQKKYLSLVLFSLKTAF